MEFGAPALRRSVYRERPISRRMRRSTPIPRARRVPIGCSTSPPAPGRTRPAAPNASSPPSSNQPSASPSTQSDRNPAGIPPRLRRAAPSSAAPVAPGQPPRPDGRACAASGRPASSRATRVTCPSRAASPQRRVLPRGDAALARSRGFPGGEAGSPLVTARLAARRNRRTKQSSLVCVTRVDHHAS